MFTGVIVIFALWLAVAIVLAEKRKAPVLWKRFTLIAALTYIGGAFFQFWPWTAGMPIVNFIRYWITFGLMGTQ